jgi:hypothetical protein
MSEDLAYQLRVLARLMVETKAPAIFEEQDAAKLRKAADEHLAMSEKEGILRMMASGRWAVCRAGREPVEITSGERFRIEFLGERPNRARAASSAPSGSAPHEPRKGHRRTAALCKLRSCCDPS